MKQLIVFPVLALTVILQSAIVSRMTLLSGAADLMLLVLAAWALQIQVPTAWHWAVLGALLTGFVSGVPWPVYLLSYLAVVALARALILRVWQAPLLAMLTVVFAGTVVLHLLTYVVLRISGNPLSLGDAFSLISLPSLLLNLLAAWLVYPLMRDLAGWVHPVEVMEV